MKNVKTIAALLLCLGLLSPASVLYAAPQGGKVVGGKASITQSGATTTINQTTDRSVINWHSFNIGQNEKFLHNMPSKNSAGLHRVVGGGGASQIQGLLQSNGNIFVVNPAGVVIHKGAKVDTNSFLATTRDITDDNFMKGNMVFDKPGLANAQIINQGTITVNDRGLAALVAPTVRNEGLIVGKLGKVALASGDSTWKLDMYGDDLISFTVDEKAVNGLYAPSGQTLGVENTGTIKAEGGVVVFTAAQLDGIVGSVVNSGEISASSAEIAGGKITFKGQGDSITLTNTGKVDASSTKSKGGSVNMVAENDIKISGKIDVNGGTAGGDVYIWSDKKTTFDGQIEAKGKDKGGFVETSGNYLKVADSARVYTLADSGKHGEWLLDPVDFTISASGGDMSGSTISANLANSSVTIQSASGSKEGNGDIFVNDAIKWSSDNTLNLEAERNIEVNATITASGNNAGLTLNSDKGNSQINAKVTLSGNNSSLSIDGNNYIVINSIDQLQKVNDDRDAYYALGSDIDASSTFVWNDGAGFIPLGSDGFGYYFSGVFNGLGHVITNLTINRPQAVHVGLFGITRNATISNVGLENASIIGNEQVGGLIGCAYSTDVFSSYTTGSVVGHWYAGGFAGRIYGGGFGERGCNFSNCFSTSDVSALYDNSSYFAGFSPLIDGANSSISNTYSTGSVSGGKGTIGGYCAVTGWLADIHNSYFDKDTANYTRTSSGVGCSTESMKKAETYNGWDFNKIWQIDEGRSYPSLKIFIGETEVTPPNPPVEPDSPDTPVVPPVTPEEPDTPVTPETPKPDTPTTPPTPPVNPDEPDTPVVPPVTPDEPDTPVVPPVTPDGLDTPSDSNTLSREEDTDNPSEQEKLRNDLNSKKEKEKKIVDDACRIINDQILSLTFSDEGTFGSFSTLLETYQQVINKYLLIELAKEVPGFTTFILTQNWPGLVQAILGEIPILEKFISLGILNSAMEYQQKALNIYNRSGERTKQELIDIIENLKKSTELGFLGMALSKDAYDYVKDKVEFQSDHPILGFLANTGEVTINTASAMINSIGGAFLGKVDIGGVKMITTNMPERDAVDRIRNMIQAKKYFQIQSILEVVEVLEAGKDAKELFDGLMSSVDVVKVKEASMPLVDAYNSMLGILNAIPDGNGWIQR